MFGDNVAHGDLSHDNHAQDKSVHRHSPTQTTVNAVHFFYKITSAETIIRDVTIMS